MAERDVPLPDGPVRFWKALDVLTERTSLVDVQTRMREIAERRGIEGIKNSTVAYYASRKGAHTRREPSLAIMEVTAELLGVPPWRIKEWQLKKARDILDPVALSPDPLETPEDYEKALDEAWQRLQRLTELLPELATEHARRAARRSQSKPPRSRGDGHGRGRSRGA
jgi:transcriptional regulator with XRE-family HTH domain